MDKSERYGEAGGREKLLVAAAKAPATSGKLNACVNKPQSDSDSDIMKHVLGFGVGFGVFPGRAGRA